MCFIRKLDPIRDIAGRPLPYVSPAGSPGLEGEWFAYRPSDRGGWAVVGKYPSEADARKAAGL